MNGESIQLSLLRRGQPEAHPNLPMQHEATRQQRSCHGHGAGPPNIQTAILPIRDRPYSVQGTRGAGLPVSHDERGSEGLYQTSLTK